MREKLPSIYDAIIKGLHPRFRDEFGDKMPLPSSITNEEFIKMVARSFNPKTVFSREEPDWFGNVPVRYEHYEPCIDARGGAGLYAFKRSLIFPLEVILGVAEGRKDDTDHVVVSIGAAICGDWASASLACCAVVDGIGLIAEFGVDHAQEPESECYVIPPEEFSRISGFPDRDGFDIERFSPLPPMNGLSRIEVILYRMVANPDYDSDIAAEEDRDYSFNSAMHDAGMSYLASPSYRSHHSQPLVRERFRLRFKMRPERARDVATRSSAMSQFAHDIRRAFDTGRSEKIEDRSHGLLCRDCLMVSEDCWCGYPGPSMRDHYPRGYWKTWSDQVGYGRNEVKSVSSDIPF